jgi:DNA-binding CsgD family transcriptional regulator
LVARRQMTGRSDLAHPTGNGKRRTSTAEATSTVAKQSGNRRGNESPRAVELSAVLPRPAWVPVTAPWSARLKHARMIVESYAVIGLPTAVLSLSGEMVTANRLFEALVPGTVRELRGRPRLTDPAADRAINDTLERLASMHAGVARSIPVRAQGGKAPAMVNIFPVAADSYDGFAGIGAILVVMTAHLRPAPSLEILRGLFNLSPAEARVAQGIASRWTVEAIAAWAGVSRETVRSQLKSVLAKTGTKRQLDLAVLLLGLRQTKL